MRTKRPRQRSLLAKWMERCKWIYVPQSATIAVFARVYTIGRLIQLRRSDA